MNEYTAEDFANAKFAEHRHGAKAVRWEMNYRVPWHTVIGDRFSDEQMAENGWRPVHEHNPHATDALEEEIQDLRDKVEGLTHQLSAGERTVAALRALAPLTLDSLREAWENAEVPTADNPIRVGDECIMPLDDSWIVGLEGDDWMPSNGDDSRVLRRAPQPEPWVELAGVLHDEAPRGVVDVDHLAERLHAAGVRVTGGDTP